MATRRLLMRQIRNVLRLRHDRGLCQREIARACSIGNGTVSDYLRRAKEVGLGWPLPEDLDDRLLELKLFTRPDQTSQGPKPIPDVAHIHKELRRPGVTRQLLWMEYREANPDGYGYTQFCGHYKRFVESVNPAMRQVHRAGEKIFVDYSGKRPTIVDPKTGEIRSVELFVGVLGASGYTYVEATLSQELHNWVDSHIRMFEYFGGSSSILVPDNLKSGVTRPCRYEPGVNRTYDELAEFYGSVVIPARPWRPKDKAKAEAGVQLAQRWILASLRNFTFFSLADLNAAIREKLTLLNNRPMQKLGVSRRELFEQLDRPVLHSLPRTRYEMGRWKTCRVNIDYHVELDRNYYSVPYQLLKEKVEVRYTHSTVEILFKSKRVASHRRLWEKGRSSTVPEHMPSSHRAHAEWTPSRIISWAEKTGPATGGMVTRIMETRRHPEQGYRACLGIMRLGNRFGPDRLEAACKRANHLNVFSYRIVQNILSSGSDKRPLEGDDHQTSFTPRHDNIRGADYYEAEEKLC